MYKSLSPNNVSWDDPPSTDEAVARLRLHLRKQSLAQLIADGLVIYDEDAHVVRKGPNFDENRLPLHRD